MRPLSQATCYPIYSDQVMNPIQQTCDAYFLGEWMKRLGWQFLVYTAIVSQWAYDFGCKRKNGTGGNMKHKQVWYTDGTWKGSVESEFNGESLINNKLKCWIQTVFCTKELLHYSSYSRCSRIFVTRALIYLLTTLLVQCNLEKLMVQAQ